ncbi:MAG: hypothetical protein GY722_08645 [bacterium]|nr:hypothetical protein [bacterium]
MFVAWRGLGFLVPAIIFLPYVGCFYLKQAFPTDSGPFSWHYVLGTMIVVVALEMFERWVNADEVTATLYEWRPRTWAFIVILMYAVAVTAELTMP